MGARITRRDFLNDVSVAVGGSITGGLLPGLAMPGRVSWRAAPQDRVGYYPPALTGLSRLERRPVVAKPVAPQALAFSLPAIPLPSAARSWAPATLARYPCSSMSLSVTRSRNFIHNGVGQEASGATAVILVM